MPLRANAKLHLETLFFQLSPVSADLRLIAKEIKPSLVSAGWQKASQ